METVIAVIMCSITVIRNLFVRQNKTSDKPTFGLRNLKPGEKSSYQMQLIRRFKKSEDLESRSELPEVPGATITGLRTCIRRYNRETLLNTQQTDISTQVEDDDSHWLIAEELPSTTKPKLIAQEDITSQGPTQSTEDAYRVLTPFCHIIMLC